MSNKSVVSLGMFDLFKGITMLLIVFGHTYSNYSFTFGNSAVSVLLIAFLGVVASGNAMLFVVSGYGYRKSPVWTCIKQQSKYMLKPFIYTAIGTVALNFTTRYVMFKSVKTALKSCWSVAGGFILAIPENHNINGIDYYASPMWYMFSLYVGWIFYNIIRNTVKNEKVVHIVTVICVVVGTVLQHYHINYFCIPQGLLVVFCLHLGYMLKKSKVLHNVPDIKLFISFGIIYVGLCAYLVLTGKAQSTMDTFGGMDPIASIMTGLVSCGILIYMLQINRLPIKQNALFRTIGNYSFLIFCAHTVEIHGIPWYIIPEKLGADSFVGLVITYLLRWVIIAIIVYVCNHYKNFWAFLKGGKRYA